MANPASYRAVFADGVADFLVAQPKPVQRKVLEAARRLAVQPFIASDYSLRDESGRDIGHLLVEDFVFAYWVDHAAKEVRIVEIEDAS